MANVIVATFTNLLDQTLDTFRQGFVDALVREGNNVLLFQTNHFLKDHQNSNTLSPKIDKDRLVTALQNFQPDLVVSMNHSGLFPDWSDSIECPIANWLLDGPAYLIEPDECRKQAHRYHMFIATRAFRNDLRESFGMPDSHIHDLPLASDFQAHESALIHNIAFVGTNFTGYIFQRIVDKHSNDRNVINKIRALVASYRDDRDMVFGARIKKYGLETICVGEFDEAYLLNILSINFRIKVLDAVESLGLALYGSADWGQTIQYSAGLALSFDPRPVLIRSDLESIYNASKINLNISHSQARGGLPWRVFDVMACNGLLVSDYQADLHRLFGQNLKIPIYSTPSEAYELCQKLLDDEPHRRFIMESCQWAIESGHRFKHRLERISQIVDVNLLAGGAGHFEKLNAEDFYIAPPDELLVQEQCEPEIKVPQFSLQIFQSRLLEFAADQSILLNIDVPENKQITGEFILANSMPFIRLDIGEYFSQHTNVQITVSYVSQSSSNNKVIQVIDLSKIIQSNEFYWHEKELYCGFDSFCVFENPFPRKNITVHFESVLKTAFGFVYDMDFSKIQPNSKSKVIDILHAIHPVLNTDRNIDPARLSQLLYQLATTPLSGNEAKKIAIGTRIKAKLLYYRFRAKCSNLLRRYS